MKQTVLAIGLKGDPHIQAVGLAVVEAGGEYVLFDPSTDDSPLFSQIGDEKGHWALSKEADVLDFELVSSVFCRFAIDSVRPDSNLGDVEKFGVLERLQAALVPLRSIRPERWMNDPWLEARADCKVMQRNLASALGLRTPRQAISSSLDELEAYFAGTRCVVKPLSDASFGVTADGAFCERSILSDRFRAPYTADFDFRVAREVPSDGTPLLIQERVEKQADIRCMVVDDDVHAFVIRYRTGDPIDFRLAPLTDVKTITLSRETNTALVSLNQEMGIRFSACDLILSQGGDEVFLEANVSGNWLFCDIHHNMSVTRDVARKLLTGNFPE